MENCIEMDADFRLAEHEMTGWDQADVSQEQLLWTNSHNQPKLRQIHVPYYECLCVSDNRVGTYVPARRSTTYYLLFIHNFDKNLVIIFLYGVLPVQLYNCTSS